METLGLNTWTKYKNLLAKLSNQAAEEFRDAVWNVNGKWHGAGLGNIPRNELIDYAYALVTKYSDGASATACIFYDELAALSGAAVPAAVPAESATIAQVGKAVNGAIKNSKGNAEVVSSTIGRLVKQSGQDTTLQNALRDGAQFAWIPSGDTCAFCLGLAALGWQKASAKNTNGGHAQHIHGNCDCAYAVRFNNSMKYAGYNPQEYADKFDMWAGHRLPDSDELNAVRRAAYQQNKEKINAQKRAAYAKRKELNSSAAEEINVD